MSMPGRPETGSRRLFFGLPLPDTASTALQAAYQQLPLPATVRPSRRDNYHLTLVFLGQVSARQLSCVQRAAERITAPRFQLRLDRLDHWPKPQALFAAPSDPPDALQQLVTGLQQQLSSCGYAPEQRRYQPHVTLARRLPAFDGPGELEPIKLPARQFHLYESLSTSDGVRYQPIRSWHLTGD